MTDEIPYCNEIKHEDYSIGLEFKTDTGIWRCTDIGQRTITAIKISDITITTTKPDGSSTTRLDESPDTSWFNGPPYAVQEVVFDENDLLDLSEMDWSEAKPLSEVIRRLKPS